MKPIVVYKSRTGYTQKYAGWIAEELGADLYNVKDVSIDKINEYDTLVYGGGLYASGIGGIGLIKRNLDKLNKMKIAVFAVGATPPRERDIGNIKKANFTETQLEKIRFFYLRGGFDFSKLDFMYKIIMTFFKIKLKATAANDPDAKAMLTAYEKPMDFSDKRNIKPLVDYVAK